MLFTKLHSYLHPKKIIMVGLQLILGLGVIGCSGSMPRHLGVKAGQLSPCPDSPNCVSRQETKSSHAIKAIEYRDSKIAAQEKMLTILHEMKEAEIKTQENDYWHVEFTSRWMRFVDDVEFYFPEDEPIIHMRSASRLGYSDLGVNRKRIENIRSRFEEK